MGVGFVLGGYCPGTSFCGAAVGRIDAMLFVGGGVLGAWGFGEAFPRIQALYTAGSMGDLTLPAALGIAPGWVVVAFALVAIAAFIVTGRIEQRVNPESPIVQFPLGWHAAGAVAMVAVAVAVASMSDRETRIQARAADPGFRRAHQLRLVTADEVAFRLLDHDPRLQLIDTRAATAFTAFSLPGAVNIQTGDLFGKTWREPLSRTRDLKVFFADDQASAADVAAVAEVLGYENVAVLGGGLQAFRRDVLQVSSLDQGAVGRDTLEFRMEAAPKLAALIQARGAAKPAERKVKKVAGGCGV